MAIFYFILFFLWPLVLSKLNGVNCAPKWSDNYADSQQLWRCRILNGM